MNLEEAIAAAIDDMDNSDTPSMLRQRPYDGQPWTNWWRAGSD